MEMKTYIRISFGGEGHSIEEITKDISSRLDYESDEYSRLIDELTDANARLEII